MTTLKKSLTRFLTNNNSWIQIVFLIVFSFMWVMTFRVDFGASYVYLNYDKWLLFFKLFGALLISFSPVLLFSFFRTSIASFLPLFAYYATWILLFILYPIILGLSGIPAAHYPVSMHNEIIWIIANIIIAIEIFTTPKNRFGFKADFSSWTNKVSPEWLVVNIFFLLSIYGSFQLINTNGAQGRFLSVWFQSIIVISVYYLFYRINHYYLINHIYNIKGIVYYSFAFVGLMVIFYLPLAWLYFNLPAFNTLLNLHSSEEWIGTHAPLTFWSIPSGTITGLMLLTIPLTILIQWFIQSNKINNLQKEKSDTELNLLKQQINPHFFFNTLNNVYSMSLTKDNKAPEAILQLSDLMRYVIYKGQETTVTLSEEVKYIEDYLELQKLRLHQDFDMQFIKNIVDKDYHITPLLFIILIENAFKHGIEGAERASFLHLSIEQNEKHIKFSCINSVEENKMNHSGLGLQNLKRRLELIYPDQHQLRLDKRNDQYSAILTIDL